MAVASATRRSAALELPSSVLPSTATALARLKKLGIERPFDLILHLPLRYEDETKLTPIAQAHAGQTVVVEGKVIDTEIAYRPRRMLVCRVRDDSGMVNARFLYFYPSQAKSFAVGARVRLFGEIRDGFFGAEMVHPRYRIVAKDEPLPTTLTPVYPTTAGLSQDKLRKLIADALKACDLTDTLPAAVLREFGLTAFEASVRRLHHPPAGADLRALEDRSDAAWRRIKFDELLAQQLSMRLHRKRRNEAKAARLPPKKSLTSELLKTLPFALTAAQRKTAAEIARDLGSSHPMQRLLQGDVGSGKTIVAALAALQAIENGYQAAIMAPTEILAEQHYRKFSSWLEPLGVEIAWLAGNVKKKERDAALARIAEGSIKLAIGTHALFQDRVRFAKLGLAVIDEQHRFGVHQRLALGDQRVAKKLEPHRLMMSATPIPRTLAMSYFADLDVSIIDELPPGRRGITTKLVADSRRDQVMARVRDACLAGGQVYWVCPLIEESETLQLQTALATYHALSASLPDIRVGLVHGRLSGDDKGAAMQAFQRNEIQLLVATTVIEVGVDVPNASLMVIEHAERMGLAQLHQLRGRVGRGAAQSTCILLYQNPLGEAARERLKIIFENTDGFEIARRDLGMRGPGEFLGARQSGVPMLRFADISVDLDLLDAARATASALLEDEPAIAARHLTRWFGDRQNYLRA